MATSAANPRLHSLWAMLLPVLLPRMGSHGHAQRNGGSGAAAAMAHVDAFWSCVVERGLLSSPSHERKFTALALFQALLPHLSPDHVPVVFSRAFSRILLNNLRKADNYLHAAARRCMDAVVAFADGGSGSGGDGSTQLAVAAALQRLGKVCGTAGETWRESRGGGWGKWGKLGRSVGRGYVGADGLHGVAVRGGGDGMVLEWEGM
eukprot:361441-Chlamydomonas_euryale.AAC.1